MRWRRLGQIFDPEDHGLAAAGLSHAQSPQAILFDDFVRVFFSSRRPDSEGKFLSNVYYADFTPDFGQVLDVAKEPVIRLGPRGAFDEHGIFPMNVLRDSDRILGYTTGWTRRVAVSVDAAVGLAISEDGGRSFRKVGVGPVLAPSLHEPFLLGDPFVVRRNDGFHMWYICGVRWIHTLAESEPQRVYKVFHATSSDGIDWRKQGVRVLPDAIGEDECQALPTVLELDGRLHMIFCYRYASGFRSDPTRGYRLGYASSEDGRNWTRDDSQAGLEVAPEGWDAAMQCYPHLFRGHEDIFLLYNGNDFGRHGFGAAVLEAE